MGTFGGTAFFFAQNWLSLVLLALFGFLYRSVLKTLSSQTGFNELSKIANPDISWIEKYRYLLGLGLDRVEGFLSPSQKTKGGLFSTFDAESLEKLFILAIIYPIVSTVYNYFKFEDGARLGELLFFPGTGNDAKRIIALAVFIGSLCMSIQVTVEFRRNNISPSRNPLLYINVLIVFLAAMMITFPYVQPYNFFESFFGSVGVSFLYVGALVYIGTSRCGEMLLIATCCALVTAFQAWALVGIPFACLLYFGHVWLKKHSLLHISAAITPLSILLLAGGLIFLSASVQRSAAEVTIVLFGTILSTTNGFFDWLSVATTRLLLRLNLTAGPLQIVCYTILDFVFAFAIVIGLIFSCGMLINIANQASLAGGGPCMLDLASFVDSITAQSEKYRWLYITLYLTFLPSLLHCYLMAVALCLIFLGWGLRHLNISKTKVREVYIARLLVASVYSGSLTILLGIIIIVPLFLTFAALENEGLFRDSAITLLRLGTSLIRLTC